MRVFIFSQKSHGVFSDWWVVYFHTCYGKIICGHWDNWKIEFFISLENDQFSMKKCKKFEWIVLIKFSRNFRDIIISYQMHLESQILWRFDRIVSAIFSENHKTSQNWPFFEYQKQCHCNFCVGCFLKSRFECFEIYIPPSIVWLYLF